MAFNPRTVSTRYTLYRALSGELSRVDNTLFNYYSKSLKVKNARVQLERITNHKVCEVENGRAIFLNEVLLYKLAEYPDRDKLIRERLVPILESEEFWKCLEDGKIVHKDPTVRKAAEREHEKMVDLLRKAWLAVKYNLESGDEETIRQENEDRLYWENRRKNPLPGDEFLFKLK